DVRRDDPDDEGRPDDRSEGDQGEDDLALLRDTPEQQARRPAERGGQDLAGEPAQHAEDPGEEGHQATARSREARRLLARLLLRRPWARPASSRRRALSNAMTARSSSGSVAPGG